MKIQELRKQTKDKLEERLIKLKKELNELVFDIKVGQEKDYSLRGKKSKEIARILTILKEESFGKKDETEKKAKEPKTEAPKEVERDEKSTEKKTKTKTKKSTK